MGGGLGGRRNLLLAASFPWLASPGGSFLFALICGAARARAAARPPPIPPPNLTRVFIKESSCSMALRRNGDRLWHNYTNPCMSLGLMEAEHLTQTKCTGADQFRGAFFPHLSRGQLSPMTGHLHMRCISVMVIPAIQEPTPPRDWYRSTVGEASFKDPHIKESQGGGWGGGADFRLLL